MWRICLLSLLIVAVSGHYGHYHYPHSGYFSPRKQPPPQYYSRNSRYYTGRPGPYPSRPHFYRHPENHCDPFRSRYCTCMVGECPETKTQVFRCGYMFSRYRCCDTRWVSQCIIKEIFGGYNYRPPYPENNVFMSFLLSELIS